MKRTKNNQFNLPIIYSIFLAFQLFGIGIFLRMFMTIIESHDFIWGYVGLNIFSVILGLILASILLKMNNKRIQVVIILNVITAIMTYQFLFSMPEFTNDLDSIEFSSWDPFMLLGSPILLYLFIAIQMISLVVHIVMLGYFLESRNFALSPNNTEPKVDSDTKLSESKLSESKLSESKLSESKLSESKLSETKMSETSIETRGIIVFLIILIILGFLVSLISPISPKLYLLTCILVLLVENIFFSLTSVDLNSIPLKNSQDSPLQGKDPQKGRFWSMFGYFLLLVPTLLVVVNQRNIGNDIENLMKIMPYVFIGYFVSLIFSTIRIKSSRKYWVVVG
jgi:hypothetical protein